MKPIKNCDMPPFEVWLAGTSEYVFFEEGEYKVKPNSPGWVKKGLQEYQSMMKPQKDKNGLIIQN